MRNFEVEKAEPEEEKKAKAEIMEQDSKQAADAKQTEKLEDTPKSEKDDLSKGYTYTLAEGKLKLTYKNTGNSVILAEAGKNFDDIMNANKSHNGLRLYFETPADNTNEIHYVDLQTLKIKYFTEGVFVRNVGKHPYDNSVIINRPSIDGGDNYFAYSSAGQELGNLGNELSEDTDFKQ